MSHTPGPWKIGTPPPNGEQTIGNSQGLMVAVATTGFNVPTLANARLIAAAPELLEALESMVEMVEMNGFGKAYAMDISRAAIAKARGQE
jgi:hypothetical protein